MNFQQSIEVAALIAMMVVIAWSWCKNEKSVWKSFLYTVLTCGIFYLNAPNFLSIVKGSELKNEFISLPFKLYNQYGSIYIIATNILLALVGLYLGQEKNYCLNNWKIKKHYDRYVSDATSLKIIGRDLDFLIETDGEYKTQREKIRNLGNQAKLLCAWTDDQKLISLYHDLLKCGNQVRAYTNRDGIANLKGQIKVDEHNERSGVFVSKSPQTTGFLHQAKLLIARIPKIGGQIFRIIDQSNLFEVTEMENGYLLDAVDQQFNRTFANCLHPVIRCIALDLGGVYLDGNIDTFYEYLQKTYGISIKKKAKDRLNIDNNLMIGRSTIKEFIKGRVRSKAVLQKLSDNSWEDILNYWQHNWQPNSKIKAIVEELSELGYIVVPFSNLDRQNGAKYVRDHYLPECCTTRWFSYERQKSKPASNAFEDFTKMVREKGYIHESYQILLIDDESKNLEIAESQGWETISFYNDPSKNSVDELLHKLKQKGIMPESYSIQE